MQGQLQKALLLNKVVVVRYAGWWWAHSAEAARLNFATLQFLDKELIINFAGQELRITDIVAEVATWEGVTETIIVHLEVEGRDKVTLPQRMSEYYALLF